MRMESKEYLDALTERLTGLTWSEGIKILEEEYEAGRISKWGANQFFEGFEYMDMIEDSSNNRKKTKRFIVKGNGFDWIEKQSFQIRKDAWKGRQTRDDSEYFDKEKIMRKVEKLVQREGSVPVRMDVRDIHYNKFYWGALFLDNYDGLQLWTGRGDIRKGPASMVVENKIVYDVGNSPEERNRALNKAAANFYVEFHRLQ